MNEIRSHDKNYVESRRIRETSMRNRSELPRLNDSNEYYSRQESLATATTPLMRSHAHNSSDNTIYLFRDSSVRNLVKIP